MTLPQFYREAYRAVVDFDSYRDICKQRFPRTLVFLLYLAAHSSAIMTLAFGFHVVPAMRGWVDWARENFPPLTIQQGKLSVDVDQPTVLEYVGDRIYTVVFDTRKDHEPVRRFSAPAVMFTESELVFLEENGETLVMPFQLILELKWGRSEDWEELDQFLGGEIYLVVYSLFLITALIGKILQSLFLSFFSLSAAARQGTRLAFLHHVNIAAYGLTPAVVIDLIVVGLGQPIPYFSVIYLITAAAYSYLATLRCLSTGGYPGRPL